MPEQISMPETDTDLSIAADKFLEAVKDLKLSKDLKQKTEDELLSAMRKHRKYQLSHGWHILQIKEGKEQKDKILVK